MRARRYEGRGRETGEIEERGREQVDKKVGDRGEWMDAGSEWIGGPRRGRVELGLFF